MYDFKTLVSRKNTGSNKWDGMYAINPGTPEGIIPFSVADMEFKNPPEIAEGLAAYFSDCIMGYTSATESYYDAVIGWMQRRHQWEIKKEWIVEYPGVVPALFHLVRLLTQPDEGVIIMTPVYYPFYTAINNGKREIVESKLQLKGNRYEIDFEDFESKAKDSKNTLFILCSPHNPAGRVWSRQELEKIGRICIDNNIMIISDEIHFDLVYKGHKHTVFAGISEEFADHCITCTAPSKTFNTAGLMTSNLIISNSELRQKVYEYRQGEAVFFCNIAGYKACEIAYDECESWLDELLLVLEANRNLVNEFVKKNIPQIKVISLEGTYLQWLDCRDLGMDHLHLEKFMQEKAMLFLDEGYIFGDSGQGFERINIACPTSVLQSALDRLLAAINNQ